MPTKDATHVKLRRTTYDRLARALARYDEAYATGQVDPLWDGERPTFDWIVNHLLDHVENDQRRKRKSRAKRRADRRVEREQRQQQQ